MVNMAWYCTVNILNLLCLLIWRSNANITAITNKEFKSGKGVRGPHTNKPIRNNKHG
jgi:hypothetical protein